MGIPAQLLSPTGLQSLARLVLPPPGEPRVGLTHGIWEQGCQAEGLSPDASKAPVPGSRSSLSSVLLGSHKAYYKAMKMEKFSDCFRRKQMARGEGMSQCFLA